MVKWKVSLSFIFYSFYMMKKHVLISAAILASFLIAGVPVLAKTKTTNPAKLSCIQTAVSKREASLITGYQALTTSIVGALNQRKTELNTAWGNTSVAERRVAIKNAWKMFGDNDKAAHVTWRTAKASAWATFKAESKACGASAALDTTTSAADKNL